LSLLPFFLLSTPLLWAQLYTGSVTGVVTDPSGAPIPAAKITLVDQQKGFTFTTSSNREGRYYSEAIPPGVYNVTVVAKGFADGVRPNLRLEVDQHLTVDFAMALSAAVTKVQVTAAAPLLAAQDAVTGQVVNSMDLADLPGHSVMGLVYLAPGVGTQSLACPTCQLNNFYSAGSRNATSDVLLDGVTTTTQTPNSGIVQSKYQPSSDAVEQFVVQESNFSAEYGFTGSTIINMITKSGTNKYHGVLFEYIRNNIFNAQNFFNNLVPNNPVTGMHDNNFGGTAGGPIKKDKLFFFANYEGDRLASIFSDGIVPTPSAAQLQGNFGELCTNVGGSFNSSGQCTGGYGPLGQLWDPYSSVYSSQIGGAVRSQIIPFNNLNTYQSSYSGLAAKPGNLINSVGMKMAQFFPAPNIAPRFADDNLVVYNYNATAPTYQKDDRGDIKLDYRVSDKGLLEGKFSDHTYNHPALICIGNEGDPCNAGDQILTDHLAAVNYTHNFTPNLLASFALGYSRTTYDQEGIGSEPQYKGLSPTSIGMASNMDYNGIAGLPDVVPDTFLPLGQYAGVHLVNNSDTFQLTGMATWMKGHHMLKFGAEGRMYRVNSFQPTAPDGEFAFNTIDGGVSEITHGSGTCFTNLQYCPYGSAVASMEIGLASSGAYQIPMYVSTRSFNVGAFVQDNWNFSQNLTVNLGLRYEVWMPRTERWNRMAELDPNVVSPLQVPSLGTLHGGMEFMGAGNGSNYNLQPKNFGPRVGFAYRLGTKSVVRGGYGIYYSTSKSAATGVGTLGFDTWSSTTPLITTYQNNGYTPAGLFNNPFPNGFLLPTGNSLGLLSQVGLGADGPIPSLDSRTPYEQTWTLGVQRTMPLNFLLEANYIGKRGTHLYFGGTGQMNLLPESFETATPAQLAALATYVANPFAGIITNPQSTMSAGTIQAAQLQVPFPQFTQFLGDALPTAESLYNALTVRGQKRFSNGLQFLATYVFSKSMDNSSSSGGNLAWLGTPTSLQDPYRLYLEKSLSYFDQQQIFHADFEYALPVGRGKYFGSKMNKVLDGVVGGWQANGIITLASGIPLPIGLSGGVALPGYSQRPNLSAPLECATGSLTSRLTQYFANPSVATAPAEYALGTAPRTIGSCRAPGQNNADLSALKYFSFERYREGMKLQFRLEAYNALNKFIMGQPNMGVNSGSFGAVTGQGNSPRQLSAAVKLYW
jgi:hypothetical protein